VARYGWSISALQPRFVPAFLSIKAGDDDRAIDTVIPHTTSLRGSRFEVSIKKRFLQSGGFDAQNPISVPHAKFIQRLGSLNESEFAVVEDRVKVWLGFSEPRV
jgi:mRNA interferase MazF